MHEQSMKPANLDASGLTKIQQLEAQFGEDVVVIAYAKVPEPAELTNEQLRMVQEMEQEMGDVCIIAWKKPKANMRVAA